MMAHCCSQLFHHLRLTSFATLPVSWNIRGEGATPAYGPSLPEPRLQVSISHHAFNRLTFCYDCFLFLPAATLFTASTHATSYTHRSVWIGIRSVQDIMQSLLLSAWRSPWQNTGRISTKNGRYFFFPMTTSVGAKPPNPEEAYLPALWILDSSCSFRNYIDEWMPVRWSRIMSPMNTGVKYSTPLSKPWKAQRRRWTSLSYRLSSRLISSSVAYRKSWWYALLIKRLSSGNGTASHGSVIYPDYLRYGRIAWCWSLITWLIILTYKTHYWMIKT